MKKTVMVNLWGQVFHIDEDAFEVLQQYLSRIERRFVGSEEGKEILEDVESRLAELFKERLGETRQVVNMDDINFAIGIIGTPEDFDEPESDNEKKNDKKEKQSHSKRLYRDPDNRMIGGVGGGLAAYFGIDSAIIRLILILTLFVSGPLIYLVLWIVMPEAQTTAQKLEMSGEPVNLSNIEKKIKNEFGKVKDTIKSDKTKKEIRRTTRDLGSILASIFHVLLRVFLTVLGVSFLVLGIVILLALIVGFFFNTGNNVDVFQLMGMVFESDVMIVALIGLGLILFIPVFSLIFAGIRLIFGIHYSFKILRRTLLGFFLFGLIITSFVLFLQFLNFRYKCQSNEVVNLDTLHNKTLVLSPQSMISVENDSENIIDSEKWLIINSENGSKVYGKPSVSIQKTKNELSSISVLRFCRHGNSKEGVALARKMNSTISVADTNITVSEYFPIESNKIFRFQEEKVIIHLPVGTKIFIKKGMEDLFYDVEMPFEYSYSELTNKTWIMTENGLELMK